MNEQENAGALYARTYKKVLGFDAGPVNTPLGEAARDFIFQEVWPRPGLDITARRWITLTCMCASANTSGTKYYFHGYLNTGEVTEEQLREFVLQFSTYMGFAEGAKVEFLLNEVLRERANQA